MNKSLASLIGWVVAILAVAGIAVFLALSHDGPENADVRENAPQVVSPRDGSDAAGEPSRPVSEEPEGGGGGATAGIHPRRASKTPLNGRSDIERPRLEPGAPRRLTTKPQVIKSVLKTTGRGENADWGLNRTCSFDLTFVVVCDSEIVKREETVLGKVEVVEKRTYRTARQVLQLSDCDVALALRETLPLEHIAPIVDGITGLFQAHGNIVAAGLAQMAGRKLDEAIDLVDGKSVRGVFGMFGVDVSDSMRRQIDRFVTKSFDCIPRPEAIEGKTYLITYFQEKDGGLPLRVSFSYEDGSQIQTEEEWMVLRRANAFIDSRILPDRNCSPGDTWKVDASDFDCLLDPYVEGAYSGEVAVERLDDDASGDWRIAVKPGSVSVVGDNGAPAGEVQISDGLAQVDGRNSLIKAMEVTGKGMMKHLSRHHLLFNTRFEGVSTFRAAMTTQAK